MKKTCLQCKQDFTKGATRSEPSWVNAKYCSWVCSAQSRVGKPGGMLGKVSPNKGKRMSEEQKLKLSIAHKGKTAWNKGKKGEYFSARTENGMLSFREKMSGVNNPKWISDRTKLAKKQERNDSAYREWRKSVRNRDGWLCKMANGDCLGKVVAHHILPWAKFLELRYEVNNGITLCTFHHPRKRDDEMRLSPYFQSLLVNET